MRFFVCENKDQLIHVSSGQLLSEDRFIHPRRKIDTWVIIICTKGKLYISQDNRHYTLSENQYIILLAGHEHFGFKESDDKLSYYWCHFRIKGKFDIAKHDDLSRIFDTKYSILPGFPEDSSQKPISTDEYTIYHNELDETGKINDGGKHFSRYYVLPEYGDISSNGRAVLIFRQLLDLARNDCYSDMLPNYALSLLAMEISQEFIESYFLQNNREFNPKMEKIIEWIRVNYNRRFSMDEIAKNFSYNADYLSTAFRRYTGIPLMKYINIVRISNAKSKLLNTTDGIKEIAWRAGFEDEKSFMKRFKQFEGITPSTYRNAFHRSKIVRE
jgi:AraC-like DNA-binding protein